MSFKKDPYGFETEYNLPCFKGGIVKNYNENVSSDELQIRTKNLQKALCEKDVNGAVIAQNTDLFYFTGTSSKGWLYVPSQGKPILAVFNDLSRVKQESPLDNIVDARSIDEIP